MKIIFLNLMKRMAIFTLTAVLGTALSFAQQVVTMNNAGFESWDKELPVSWLGSSSNIPKSSVFVSKEAYTGIYSCRLLRTQKTHVRFGTTPIALTAGNYQLSYFIKGNGCIRNSFYNGTSYAAYSDFDTLTHASWRQIVYDFELNKDAEVQLLFSLCQTDTIGLFIDDVSLKSVLSALPTSSKKDLPRIAPIEGGIEVYMPFESEVCVVNIIGQVVYRKVLPIGVSVLTLRSGSYIIKSRREDFCQKIYLP